MKKPQYIIGIDEAGRGPLAGPVAVGVAFVPKTFKWKLLPGVTDSKALSPKKREVIYATARALQKTGELDYEVVMVSAKRIDIIGISVAIKQALAQALTKLEKRHPDVNFATDSLVQLDGGLKASSEYLRQETIIKGDLKVKEIGLGSIMAKVTRDQYMEKLASKSAYTAYNFAKHKGYGTQAHLAAITAYGTSAEHRLSFCKNINPVRSQ